MPKIPQNDKKLCPLCLMSLKLYITGSSFMVHMWKRIISPGILLHFFQILIFVFSHTPYLRKHTSHSIFQKWLIISSRFFLVHRCKIASVFLYFFLKKINIVNIKILAFFIGPLHQLFNKQLFFKFIKKC